jgi:hypothetical protein
MRQLEVRMLGGFQVLVDSKPVPDEAWMQRRATDLVKVLALASGHRLARDEVLEMLWPKLGAAAAASNLHKAASYTRRALGDRDAVAVHTTISPMWPSANPPSSIEVAAMSGTRRIALPRRAPTRWMPTGRLRRRSTRAPSGPLSDVSPPASRS